MSYFGPMIRCIIIPPLIHILYLTKYIFSLLIILFLLHIRLSLKKVTTFGTIYVLCTLRSSHPIFLLIYIGFIEKYCLYFFYPPDVRVYNCHNLRRFDVLLPSPPLITILQSAYIIATYNSLFNWLNSSFCHPINRRSSSSQSQPSALWCAPLSPPQGSSSPSLAQ